MKLYVDNVPLASCIVQFMQKQQLKKPYIVLFDSGSSHTWWNGKSLPKGCVPQRGKTVSSTTLAGDMQTNLIAKLEGITFPEFFKTRKIDSVEARVFHADCRYDAIIGRDLLEEMGLILDFKNSKMSWDECHVPMRPFPSSNAAKQDPSPAEQLYMDMMEADLEDDDTLPTCDMTEEGDCDYFLDDEDETSDNRNTEDNYQETKTKHVIKESKYETANIDEVVRSCSHLSQNQQNDLREVLTKYPTLFNNTLGTYPDEKIHLDIKDDAVPHATRAYTVPQNHRAVFKAELDRLVRIGVLEEGSRSEWMAGTFIVPKKLLPGETTPRVRWVSDFRGLNKALKRKMYPIPKIGDILARRTGYQFLTKMDISMQYYTFELDDESAELCTIATPFGVYRYRKMPMGISQAPDIAQEMMEKTLKAIEDLEVYIDDIGIFSKDWT